MKIEYADGIASARLKLMGNRFEFTAVHSDKSIATESIIAAIAEVKRIENLLSTYKQDSQTQLINTYAGIGHVKVDKEVVELIQRSNRISELTQGAFDITYGSIDKSLWNFDKMMTKLPDIAVAKAAVKLINFKNIIINGDDAVMLKEKGMRIGFGGIGKGYAAERAKHVMKGLGILDGIVNASGDLCVWGHHPSSKPWIVGIAHPDNPKDYFSTFPLGDAAVATSGNYEKFVIINGKKYSHTIDPKTGMPIRGIKSVSIICPNAEFADALATPIAVMGIQAGMYLVNQLQNVECIIIDDNNNVYKSKNINFL
jgi:thiamine biosynthesis lipoprotein